MDALFLDHYDRELAFLREMGSAFANQYPKLAGQLGLDEFQCSDPFVERLLEGFAFMSARVQRRLDAEFPQLTRAIFEAVFPHYARPIPSAGIFQLNPAHDEGSLVAGYTVPRGTRLLAEPALGQQTGVRFDTTADTQLWPLRISQVGYHSRDAVSSFPLPPAFYQSNIRGVLHIALETTAAVPINAIQIDRLRFHLRGGDTAHQLYESLLAHTNMIAIAGPSPTNALTSQSWNLMASDQMRAIGFEDDAMLSPGDSRSFTGYRLLQDYFILPEKFLFVELDGLRSHIQNFHGNQVHLLFAIEHSPGKAIERASTDHVVLHCVPAINLFPKRADRIHLDHTQHEHQLISDRSRPLDFEIWSIEEMAAHKSASAIEALCLPLYAPPTSKNSSPKNELYYTLDRRQRVLGDSRTPSHRHAYLGSEVYLSLTDSQGTASRTEYQQLSSQVYCTNRDLPLLTPERGWRTGFRVESAAPIANVLCLVGPTPPRGPLVTEQGESAWRLVGHLTPNYLSLMDSQEGGAAMLRELLQLYCAPENNSSLRQIEGLRNVRQNPVVRRLPMPGPLTFAQGLEIELQCDEEAFEGGGAFLLASVLEQFFARFVTINSFTELHLVSTKRGSIHRWPPRTGTTPLL